MDIFNDLIRKTMALLPGEGKSFSPSASTSRHQGHRGELILGREAAYELGGGDCPCVSYALYTEDTELVGQDEILVYGSDLNQLRSDSAFARIALIRTDYIEKQGEQGAYGILENIGIRKYDVFPKGYMVRTAALSNREQVRISKAAVKAGLTFRDVGSLYIDEYKKNPHVQAVKMIFVTLPEVDYLELDRLGTLSDKMFRALNKMLADIKMNCKACEWKVVCDEVEGMKELHEKMLQNQH